MRAPGADDNGSGTSAMLEIASVIKSMEVQFKRGVRICFFSGMHNIEVLLMRVAVLCICVSCL